METEKANIRNGAIRTPGYPSTYSEYGHGHEYVVGYRYGLVTRKVQIATSKRNF